MSHNIRTLDKDICFRISSTDNGVPFTYITYGTGDENTGRRIQIIGRNAPRIDLDLNSAIWSSHYDWDIRLATRREKEYLDECIKSGMLITPMPDFSRESDIINTYDLY